MEGYFFVHSIKVVKIGSEFCMMRSGTAEIGKNFGAK